MRDCRIWRAARPLCIAWAVVAASLLGTGGTAQNLGGVLDPGVVQSPVLVIEFERVFAESAFGKAALQRIEQEGVAIAAQNRRIEAELIEEEKALTLQREQMAPDAFRELANAFDEKVQRLRDEQDAKARALGAQTDEARRRFLTVAQPILEALMRESGAAVILERRTVFAAAEAVDVTDQAIARIDAALASAQDGTGGAPDGGPPTQDP